MRKRTPTFASWTRWMQIVLEQPISDPEIACDFEAFAKVVRTRRCVRACLPEPIPGAVLDACFELALLAPMSHNLETWQFIDVRSADKLVLLRHYCLDQPPAMQAPTLTSRSRGPTSGSWAPTDA